MESSPENIKPIIDFISKILTTTDDLELYELTLELNGTLTRLDMNVYQTFYHRGKPLGDYDVERVWGNIPIVETHLLKSLISILVKHNKSKSKTAKSMLDSYRLKITYQLNTIRRYLLLVLDAYASETFARNFVNAGSEWIYHSYENYTHYLYIPDKDSFKLVEINHKSYSMSNCSRTNAVWSKHREIAKILWPEDNL